MSVNGDILTPNLDLDISSYPITLFHVFSIKGQHAEVVAMMNPTSISSRFKAAPSLSDRTNSKSGFSDGFVGFKIGMVNGKAKSLEEYVSTKIDFVMGDLDVSRITATKYLEQLVEKGFLHKEKVGRANYYINQALCSLLISHA